MTEENLQKLKELSHLVESLIRLTGWDRQEILRKRVEEIVGRVALLVMGIEEVSGDE